MKNLKENPPLVGYNPEDSKRFTSNLWKPIISIASFIKYPYSSVIKIFPKS